VNFLLLKLFATVTSSLQLPVKSIKTSDQNYLDKRLVWGSIFSKTSPILTEDPGTR